MLRIQLILLCCIPMLSFGQLGSHMNRVVEFIGKDQVVSTREEMGYVAMDIKTGPKELAMFYFKDSFAVMAGVMTTDSVTYDAAEVQEFVTYNAPTYTPHRKCSKGNTTYHQDTVHQIELLIQYNKKSPPGIRGYALSNDAFMIGNWNRGLTAWVKE
ncbi:MAG: hypothetical protein JNL57_07760 [Bacteroidetes bacterium]|nr:hypothetical protein [Bacteroidota bacterium]